MASNTNNTTENLGMFPKVISNISNDIVNRYVIDSRQRNCLVHMTQFYSNLVRQDAKETISEADRDFVSMMARAHTRYDDDIQIAIMKEVLGIDISQDDNKKRAFLKNLYRFVGGMKGDITSITSMSMTNELSDQELDEFIDEHGINLFPRFGQFHQVLRMDYKK